MSKNKETPAAAGDAGSAAVDANAGAPGAANSPTAAAAAPNGGARASMQEQYRRPIVVGEPVQFLPGGAQTTYVPATVTKVNDDGTADLHVLRPEFNSTDWPIAVKRGSARGEFRTLDQALDAQRD